MMRARRASTVAVGANESPEMLTHIKLAHGEEARVTKKRDYDDGDDESGSISIEDGGYNLNIGNTGARALDLNTRMNRNSG